MKLKWKPRPAPSAIASWLLISLVAGLGAGCSAPEPVSVAKSTQPELDLEYPGDFSDTRLALVPEGGRLAVGDSISNFRAYLPKPRRAYDSSDVPPGFGKTFVSRGWTDTAVSASVISLEDRIVLAMTTEEGVEDNAVQTAIDRYSGYFGYPDETIGQGKFRYAFWRDGGSVLMIGNAFEPEGSQSLSIVVGHPKAMTALSMTPGAVRRSFETANQRLEEAARKNETLSAPAERTNK